MLTRALSTVAKRATLHNARGARVVCAPSQLIAFHSSSDCRKEENPTTNEIAATKDEIVVTEPVPVKRGGLFGTGLSEWFALPIGMAAAVPLIKFDLYVINEETQLAAVFVAFCVAVWSTSGDAIYKSLDDAAVTILKEHNEAEDKVIEALQQKLDFLKANQNMVNDFAAINGIRVATYEKLNAAGAIKPQHDFKMQIERMCNMITAEETSVTEKAKVALMEEATAFVTEKFASSSDLKKAALDSAIAQIKGEGVAGGSDPVRDAFVQFFKDKAAAAAQSSDDGEVKAQREALIAKLNSVCKNEGFFFQFDENAQPKMVV